MKKLKSGLLAAVFWLAVWQVLSLLVGRELLLPGPLAVGRRLISLAATSDFWRITLTSLSRILLALLLGTVLGASLAALCSRFSLLHTLLSPLLSLIKATPVASFIILALLFLGRSFVPPFIAVLMVVPVVFGNVEAGIRAVDPQLRELAAAYGFSPLRRLYRIVLPTVRPYFLSACQTSLGLAWKAGIAAEVLTVPFSSIGRELYNAKLNLETVDLFAWTAVTVLSSVLLERGMLGLLRLFDRKGGRYA